MALTSTHASRLRPHPQPFPQGEGSALRTSLLIAIAIALVACWHWCRWLHAVASVLSPETASTARGSRWIITAPPMQRRHRALTGELAAIRHRQCVLAFSLGTLLAWINERTDTPFKALFFALTLVPLIIPGILFTVAWNFLGSPKIGIVNLVLQRVFSTDTVFINIYSIPGMIWVDGLHYSPMAFLLMTAAFRAMDPALEESP